MAKRRSKPKTVRCKLHQIYRGKGKSVIVIKGNAWTGSGSWDGGGSRIAVCKRAKGYAVPTATGMAKLHQKKS